ncbi:MAG: hypothetical protein IRY90_09440 [Actinomadura rubrobrunea]|nr:hypothetical protein [Actinomadura rubrobrunea]
MAAVSLVPMFVIFVAAYLVILTTPGGLRLRTRFPGLVGAVLPALVCLPMLIICMALGMAKEGVITLLAYADTVVIFVVLARLLRRG